MTGEHSANWILLPRSATTPSTYSVAFQVTAAAYWRSWETLSGRLQRMTLMNC